jgi:hypothetical protein
MPIGSVLPHVRFPPCDEGGLLGDLGLAKLPEFDQFGGFPPSQKPNDFIGDAYILGVGFPHDHRSRVGQREGDSPGSEGR